MKGVMCGVALIAALTLGHGWAAAQQMAPHDDKMMMHGKTLEGVVSRVRFVSCGSTPQSCQGIFEITPSESDAKMQHSDSGAAMQHSEAGHMMMQHPVTVIVIPGAGLIWQNAPLPLTRLHAGDLVKLEYTEINNMNVVTTLTMTGMAGHHM